MIKVRIEARWGETTLETGKGIEGGWVDLELTDEDMKSDQAKVFEDLKLSWASVRNNYGICTKRSTRSHEDSSLDRSAKAYVAS